MMLGTSPTSSFAPGARLAAQLALALSLSGCVVLGTYDFDGYRASQDTARPTGGGGPDGGTPPGDGSGPPDCIGRTCGDLQAECGMVPDGCGGVIDCGSCETGICGGGGRYRCG